MLINRYSLCDKRQDEIFELQNHDAGRETFQTSVTQSQKEHVEEMFVFNGLTNTLFENEISTVKI